MTFGEKVKEARLAQNLSQTELSKMTGISERSLYTYEQLGTIPRMSNVKKLAEALKVSSSYLMDEAETNPAEPYRRRTVRRFGKSKAWVQRGKRGAGSHRAHESPPCRRRFG